MEEANFFSAEVNLLQAVSILVSTFCDPLNIKPLDTSRLVSAEVNEYEEKLLKVMREGDSEMCQQIKDLLSNI